MGNMILSNKPSKILDVSTPEENPKQLMDRHVKELDDMIDKIYKHNYGNVGEIGTSLLHIRGIIIKEYDSLQKSADSKNLH